MDVGDEGFHLTSIESGVRFRPAEDSPRYQMSWTSPDSKNAWLVLDRNGNGQIDDMTEMFGNLSPQPKTSTPNGYNALSVFDLPENGGNDNGVIDPEDAIYSHLRLWVDNNHNGISEPEELYTLPEGGIFSISLHYYPSSFVDRNGNEFRFRAKVWDKSADEYQACYDVFLQVSPADKGIR